MSTKDDALALADAEYKQKRKLLQELAKIDADIAALRDQIDQRVEDKRSAYKTALDSGWKEQELKRFNVTPPPRRRSKRRDESTDESIPKSPSMPVAN